MLNKINPELLILIIGRVLQIFIMLASIRITTNLLDASEIGNLYLIISISGFFGLFLVNPVGQFINRKTHEWYENGSLLNIFYLYNFYILSLSFISVLIVYILSYFGVASNIDLFYLSLFMSLFIYFNTWNQTIIPMVNMLEKRIAFIVLTLLTQILFLLFAYVSISIFGVEGIFWFLGQIIAFGLVAIIAFFYFVRNIQSHFSLDNAHKMINISNIKYIFKFSAPLSVGILFLWMQTQSYGIIIEKYIGSEFLGFFGVGMAIALAISSSFELIIMQYLYPQMYKSMKNEDEFSKIISNIINTILPIYLLLTIFVSIFAMYIITILADAKYFDSYIYIIFGVWFSFFRMSSNMISNIAHAKLKTKELVSPYFIGAIISVFGIVLATDYDDYIYYIPAVLIISSAVSFLLMYIKMRKLVAINLELKNFYLALLYAVPFFIALYFYTYSDNIFTSIIIVGVFGIYFLYALYSLIQKGKAIG